MKIIITEEQYNRMFNSKLWLRRHYNLVTDELKDTMQLTKGDICRYDTYEDFENYFFSLFMDGLHPYYYQKENFDYKEFQSTLTDMFYVECTEFYFKYKERC
jgi:hypothetical protein